MAFTMLLFFKTPSSTEIYTLSLHDALPICICGAPLSGTTCRREDPYPTFRSFCLQYSGEIRDRKSTRLNSSHSQISYAVFCLKKKNYSAELRRFLPETVEPFAHVLIAAQLQ